LRPIWSNDIVDNDVVLVLSVVKDNGVLKLHRVQGQVLNPVRYHKNIRPIWHNWVGSNY